MSLWHRQTRSEKRRTARWFNEMYGDYLEENKQPESSIPDQEVKDDSTLVAAWKSADIPDPCMWLRTEWCSFRVCSTHTGEMEEQLVLPVSWMNVVIEDDENEDISLRHTPPRRARSYSQLTID